MWKVLQLLARSAHLNIKAGNRGGDPMGEKGPDVGNLGLLVERVSTKSALSPLIWVFGILVPAFAASSWFSSVATWIFGGCLLIVFIAIIVSYIYFMLNKPEMLGSEDHQYRMKQLMGDDRSPQTPITIDATPTANTHISGLKGAARELAQS